MLTRGNTYQFDAQGEESFDQWATNAGRSGEKGVREEGAIPWNTCVEPTRQNAINIERRVA